ncbi:metallophosphoesterase [Actinoplanes sp. RD1]|uniref:metallophosphoesterase n=1 Tax=Actinoplanes sp. RD1 TaxID=3064538 RepID=UPI0027406399|nr:metallophosphoesterase [Actinoplanes sp. RD1]
MLIAHLSDPHLLAGPLGAAPAAALHRAFARLLALEPRPDCVVITGDLVESAEPGEYALLRDVLRHCPIPVHAVAGNHDGERFAEELGESRYVVDYPGATIVVADSVIAGRAEGRLGAEQLDWIDEVLGRRPDVPAFVCLHHPPVEVGIPFLDGMNLADADALARIVARRGNVARVLAGHVHRTVVVPFAGTVVAIAPAAYRQTALRMHDAGPPGYVLEPSSFLLHARTRGGWATHSVAVSDAGAVLAY